MYTLGKTSASRMMEGVHPLLIACVCLAMRKYSTVDFGVGDGAVRTREMQTRLLESGKSKTMNSMHLPQADGYSWAVDLYPVGYKPNNKAEKERFRAIKSAMDSAAFELGIQLEHGFDWGWDMPHHQIKQIFKTNVDKMKSMSNK